MAIKAEISWHRKDSEGIKLEVYARRFGGSWSFYSRHRRHEDWQPLKPAPLEDWLELRDAIIRRIPRGLFPPDELKRIETDIRNRFPEAKF
ncbi:MAG: hypothetical protein IT581_15700 [Verrucomicrobiales bacterium]|nr:hypothetical protein [Verrucomicrobiales bacterium]